jgi:hypothetical protein
MEHLLQYSVRIGKKMFKPYLEYSNPLAAAALPFADRSSYLCLAKTYYLSIYYGYLFMQV